MGHKILFVDDEVNILDAQRRHLRGKYSLDVASSGHEALRLVSSEGPYAVIVSDMQMPEMNGLELFKELQKQTPDTTLIMLTGNYDQKTAIDALNEGHIFQFINKPCKRDELIEALNQGIEVYEQRIKKESKLTDALTNVEELSEQLLYHSNFDVLTGLINRQEFEKEIQTAINQSVNETDMYVICYVDLDQFNVINNSCGHIVGDELIRQIAVLLKKHLRKNDFLCRISGDQFGILLSSCLPEQGENVAESARKDIEEHVFKWKSINYKTTASIGVVSVNENHSSSKLLATADMACKIAKDLGRNRIHVYSLDDEESTRRHEDIQYLLRIQKAFEEDQFELAYQTIAPVSQDDQQGLHYEILIRMLDEEGEWIAPDNFLPVCEKYNLSVKLDRWVLTHTLNWLATHREHLDQLHLCSINLSGQSLGDKEFLSFVNDLFSQTKISPEKICFEITETAAISHFANAIEFIESLRNIGCLFALDDFGTGLSSFAYLKNLPVDFLKIDGTFIKDIDDNSFDYAIVKGINEIAVLAGMKTIAEFVENDSILDTLREIGVEYVQGYRIGKPMPLK